MDIQAEHNAHDLELELQWVWTVLDTRFKLYFQQDCEFENVYAVEAPDFSEARSLYAEFVNKHDMSFSERTALILSLIPHVRPNLLDIFYVKNATFDRKFTEFGGIWNGPDGDFIPTGETLAFVLGGSDLMIRFAVQRLFQDDHYFSKENIFQFEDDNDPTHMKSALMLSSDLVHRFTIGADFSPSFGIDFPAQRILTQMTWDDLVLHPGTYAQIEEIEIWIRHGVTLMDDWQMGAKIRPGYRALFYGPPGTGKTLTATLLGKTTGHPVYKVDLSLVVSKYIGETEKNLSRVFKHAQQKQWILFFDEADALFGKRSETKDSHDRYANQEVSYLLQRIETFDGIVILASNRRDDLDEAFARRFESMIYFPMPSMEERLRLWQQGVSPKSQLGTGVDLQYIAQEYALTGGAIMNVIRYASLQALQRQSNIITRDCLLDGIRREFAKDRKLG